MEGYKGFQLGFSPRVVSRAWVVSQKFELSPKTLLKRYGVAYLASSIFLSICSFTLFYELLKRGLDVGKCLAAIGITVPQGKYYGAAALAYALHKAASPIRFPPTLLLTQTLGKLIGKSVTEEDERATRALWHKLFAPAFCIGYFHGTRGRVISSWTVTTIVFFTVIAVRKLANPYRAIVDAPRSVVIEHCMSRSIQLDNSSVLTKRREKDCTPRVELSSAKAGVIVGLLWGTVSVLLLYLRSLRQGKPPDFDPCLPTNTPYS